MRRSPCSTGQTSRVRSPTNVASAPEAASVSSRGSVPKSGPVISMVSPNSAARAS